MLTNSSSGWCIACARSVCCHSYVQGGREEALVSGAKREEMLYEVAFKSVNLLKVSLVMSAAMLAICVLALVETTNTAEATSLPHNGKIAFSRNGAIYTVEPDGSKLCHFRSGYGEPMSSPTEIWSLQSDGLPSWRLADDEGPAAQCEWSPDGAKIAFSSSHGDEEVYFLYALGSYGSGQTALTSNSAADIDPDWSPDGTKITFASDRDGDFDIYTMNSDGSDVTQVTKNSGIDDVDPDWQPLSPKIRSGTVHPPDTGGPSLLLIAGALLFSVGVLLFAVVKRWM
jgi:dipeptidyl aminopeptidase/acylaminoacyl peptidase